MQDRYRLMTVRDVHEDEAAITEILTSIMNSRLRNDLKLLNYYREVPICFGATVDSMDRGVAEMTVHKLQASAMRRQNMTLMKSSHFPHDVLAKVLKVSCERDFALLTQFAYVQILSERRRHVRVEVGDSLDVTFQADRSQLRGTLNDISLGGVAIRVADDGELEENMDGTVSLSLRGARIHVPGSYLRLRGDSAPRVSVIQLRADAQCERPISQFVFQVQNEIIRELKEQMI